MRKDPLITGEYYHIYNRGVDKRDIFMNTADLSRFVLSINEFNVSNPIGSIREKTRPYKKVEQSPLPGVQHLGVGSDVLVSIVCYCFNPNHFHFIVRQESDGGISEFFKRLLGGYTNYFNKAYDRSGALFQGRFKSHLIKNNQYFLKIRPYVHLNNLIHDIPKEKHNLILSSEKEYDSGYFNIVSKKEAERLLDFYGGNKNFKKECQKVIAMIRSERGKTSLLEDDPLP